MVTFKMTLISKELDSKNSVCFAAPVVVVYFQGNPLCLWKILRVKSSQEHLKKSSSAIVREQNGLSFNSRHSKGLKTLSNRERPVD